MLNRLKIDLFTKQSNINKTKPGLAPNGKRKELIMNNQISFELAICAISQKISNKGKASHKFAPCLYINCDIDGKHYFARPNLAELSTPSKMAKLLKIPNGDFEIFRELWNGNAPEIADMEIIALPRDKAVIMCVKAGLTLDIPVKGFVMSELESSVKNLKEKLEKKIKKIHGVQANGREAYVTGAADSARDSAGKRFDNFDEAISGLQADIVYLSTLKA